jgi:osmoprotectant transport system permease protein
MKRRDVPDRGAMVSAIGDWARRTHGVGLVGALGFENAYAFAMKRDAARDQRIASLDDLVRAAPRLALGSDLEFLERPEWAAVKRAYPLRFARTTPYSPTFMYRALQSGNVDVISAFSSDGRIAADRLTVLTDPRRAIPGYDAILMVAPARARDAAFLAALKPLVGRVPVEAMRTANYQVDRDTDKQTPEAAARWLAAKIGL